MDQLTWLVTGCSSGFGRAFVLAILAKGDRVIATARSKDQSAAERLADLKASGAAVMEVDVTWSRETLDQKAKEAWSIYGSVDVLVNNAAYIDTECCEEIDEPFVRTMKNNTLGPMNLTPAFLPYMRERRKGTLIFMSSGPSCTPALYAVAYSSSKALLESIVATLGAEIEPFGLRTSVLVPGHFRTSVLSPGNVLYNRSLNPVPACDEMRKSTRDLYDAFDGARPGDPRKAAELVVEAVRGEGRCKEKSLPAWLPLGADAFEWAEKWCRGKLDACEEWRDLACDTALD
ncbi:hypothetical protein BDV25DRAFT_126325 [Aspergillus avenaceus]|uniref:Short-chain oxidoreductase n=1 Tax=Aspergillus avenaceus TaxID=36643 RepID=A0A5N6U8I8_ASPAV|nr:hypothetical protein BDV25DRAFT_126325 [Aspergillus avenaceus]